MSANFAPSPPFTKTARLINDLGRQTRGVQTVEKVRTAVRGEGRELMAAERRLPEKGGACDSKPQAPELLEYSSTQ